MINRIWVLMDVFNRLHDYLPGFEGVIGIGTEFASMPGCIAIADCVTVAAHWPSHSIDHLHPCSSQYGLATKCSKKCANAQETIISIPLTVRIKLREVRLK